MKTRTKALTDRVEGLMRELSDCHEDRNAVHERLVSAENELLLAKGTAAAERQAAVNAERERGEAGARAAAATAEAAAMREKLEDAIGQRDSWSERAQSVTVERDEAHVQLRAAQEMHDTATEAYEALRLRAAQHESRAAEALDQAQAALAERDLQRDALEGSEEARLMGERKLAEVQQALDDCRQSRGIIQTQRDTILAAAAEQGIMIPVAGPTPKVGDFAGVPLDPARKPVRDSDVEGVVIGGEFVPTVEGRGMFRRAVPLPEGFSGEPIPWAPGYTYAPAEQEGVDIAAENDAHAAEHGLEGELAALRAEDAGGDAERLAEQLQAARLGRDRALIDLSETRRKLDIERQENDREQAELARQRDALQDWRDTALQALYFAGVAQGEAFKVRAALEEDLARARKELAEMSEVAESQGSVLVRDIVDGEDPRPLIEHWQGVASRLEAERDEQREAHEQWRSDCLVARDGYSELHSRLVVMMEERDNLLVENEALNKEREDALAALQQVKAERDELRPLALLADPIEAKVQIEQAEQRMDRAEAEFGNLRRERDAWSERAETHEQERDQALGERDEARAELASVRHMAMDSMVLDGAVENALGKLVGVLGTEAYESPADVIDTATEAIKDARREAGRLKLVLDIIDERKAQQAVEVERRGHDEG